MAISFQIEFEPDRVIRGDYYPAQAESKGTLIICHGFKGFKDWGFFPYAANSLSGKLDVITFNYSHNGIGESLTEFTELEKFAKQTYSNDLQDLHILITSVQNKSLPIQGAEQPKSSPLFLLGHSRGAGIALVYALDHAESVSGVISWNGIAHLDLLTDEMKQEMRTKGRSHVENARTKQKMPLDKVILDDLEVNRDRYNMIDRVKSASFPIILVQGTNDMERLIAGSEELIQANPSIEWTRIENGNHTFQAVHPFAGVTPELRKALDITENFILKTL